MMAAEPVPGQKPVPVTLLVEPNHGGHRYQAVANVAALARRTGPVVLLTTAEGLASAEFEVYLRDADIEVQTPFDDTHPATRAIAKAVADYSVRLGVGQALLMEADQPLKRWWLDASRELRRVPRRSRPRIVLMLTRYPTTVGLTDRAGWTLRTVKAVLVLMAVATGTLHRAAGFASRDDLSRGWLVRRARDPAICLAHSRDRSLIRDELGLPADRHLVGLYGAITEGKSAPLGLDAILASGTDTDLLLAGTISDEVHVWLDSLPAAHRARVVVAEGFLPNEVLDKYVAAADIALVAFRHNAPSGIMGKALAAGVPVITAGSKVRAREIKATRGGLDVSLDVAGVSGAIGKLVGGTPQVPDDAVPPATAEEFAAVLLGVDRIQSGT